MKKILRLQRIYLPSQNQHNNLRHLQAKQSIKPRVRGSKYWRTRKAVVLMYYERRLRRSKRQKVCSAEVRGNARRVRVKRLLQDCEKGSRGRAVCTEERESSGLTRGGNGNNTLYADNYGYWRPGWGIGLRTSCTFVHAVHRLESCFHELYEQLVNK